MAFIMAFMAGRFFMVFMTFNAFNAFMAGRFMMLLMAFVRGDLPPCPSSCASSERAGGAGPWEPPPPLPLPSWL